MKRITSFFKNIFGTKSNHDNDTAQTPWAEQYSSAETITRLQGIFGQKGWQYELDENQRLLVKYQGETFMIDVTKDGCHFRVFDLHWCVISLDNLANFAMARKAINECNAVCFTSLFYGTNEKEHEMYVHSKTDITWIPFITDLATYLQDVFDEMLRAHHTFFSEMESLRQSEYAKQNEN